MKKMRAVSGGGGPRRLLRGPELEALDRDDLVGAGGVAADEAHTGEISAAQVDPAQVAADEAL
jgi:hypothetical protein